MATLDPVYLPWGSLQALRGAQADIPPVVDGLYVCGSMEGLRRRTVAIVGTRAASEAGKRLARSVAAELGHAGLCVISGLALGIDAAAHLGALEANAPTIGVLGGGHQHFFPRRNRGLAEQMLAHGGGVCSPFAPEESTFPGRFLERNSVVAALADAVVVVEAPARSGALNTAGWAAGRIPVLVFPGDVDRRSVAGCLALIRDGATLVRNAADILQEMRISADGASHAQQLTLLSPRHAQIVEALEQEPLPIDALTETTGLPPSAVLAVLTELELDGLVHRREGGVFARI